jgi:hypothetical protein
MLWIFKSIRNYFNNVLSMPVTNLVIDILHAFQRTTTKQLLCTAKADMDAIRYIQTWFSNINKTIIRNRGIVWQSGLWCGKFQLQIIEDRNKSEEEEGYEILGYGMISGKECRVITKTHKLWIEDLNEEMKRYGYDNFISAGIL